MQQDEHTSYIIMRIKPYIIIITAKVVDSQFLYQVTYPPNTDMYLFLYISDGQTSIFYSHRNMTQACNKASADWYVIRFNLYS